MKRQLRTASLPIVINIDVIADHPLFHIDENLLSDSDSVAASVDISNYDIPTRQVIARDKEKIEQWMIDDFEAFVDSIESLCETEYGLELVYENESDDLSHYYSYLAKDDDSEIIAKIRIKLRISNHPPKRGSGQKQLKKKEQKFVEEWVKLNTKEKVNSIDAHPIILTVNNIAFDSYEEAFYRADKLISKGVEVLKRKAKYKNNK